MIWIMLLFSCSITFAQFDTYDLIVEYEQECYNDSSVRYYIKLCDWDCWEVPCEKGELVYGSIPCQEHWEHREPTWDGFREFVKKKYQELFEVKK